MRAARPGGGEKPLRGNDWCQAGAAKRAPGARFRDVSLFRSLSYFVPSYFLAIVGYLAVNVVAARIRERLHSHFQQLDGTCRAPLPVEWLSDIDALDLEYVPSRTIRQLLTYGSVRRPETLLNGLPPSEGSSARSTRLNLSRRGPSTSGNLRSRSSRWRPRT